ncbi:NADH-ubiquinone/plastoquinone oxidoreductase chain 6 family protein [Orientia chuto str. Dubai]|uniref:NADH-quinone oxidoreductase subunit J n=1 Tax=Orientia chuto str. Dubai TaxID=1359168 RepID=A0A0F3MJK2_9RICK|nr:NADH-quinone oxidoreductase subunit J [Candidatus Orientia mediorientalis]KJV55930.1 NADH-ubiquinone/plastoquinone oxidoreductase chain 6 family protein [Orientia chuto str. Dubai]
MLFFYLFSILALLGGIGVIISKNAVYAVLWLIFTFCNTAGLMILLGAEFLAFLLIIVYAGAVAILFLFVVMMLNIQSNTLDLVKQHTILNVPISIIVAFIFIIDLSIVIFINFKNYYPVHYYESSLGIKSIGKVLYTEYALPFQLSGAILLIAMIGCVVLTIRKRSEIKRQNHASQINRSRSSSIQVVQVEVNRGINDTDSN